MTRANTLLSEVDTHLGSVRVRDLLCEIWRGRRIVGVITLVVTVCALVLALTATPQYRAAVLLAPAESSSPEGGLAGLAGRLGGLADLDILNLSSGQDIEQALVMLTSRNFTERFIVEEELLPHLYEELWNEKTRSWQQGSPTIAARLRAWLQRLANSLSSAGEAPARGGADGAPDLWDATKKFNRMRNVDKDRRTQIVTLSITWKDPNLAAEWANRLAERLNDHTRRKAILEATTATKYLEAEIAKTSVLELQQALYRLLESQHKKIMLATVREEYAFRILDPALPPRERISPKRTLMVLGGIVGGAFLGVLFVLVRRFAFQPA